MHGTPPIRFFDGPDGTRVAYTEHGEGPPLICPAWWVSHLEEDWAEPGFRRFFEALASGRTVVRYDRPGAGLSGGGAETTSLATEVAVLEAVFEAVGVESAALLAVSCGGPPAIVFTARHPQRVERLALFGSYADGSRIADSSVVDAVCGLVEAHWGMGSQTLANIFHPGLSGRDLRRLGRRQRAAADAGLACRLLRLTYAMDASDCLDDVRCPALVIHRRGDRAVPFEAGRHLAASLPDASFVPVDGTAHLPWEGAEEVLSVLGPFLGLGLDADPGKTSDGAESAPGFVFDRENRELSIEGQRRPLTPLEHGLLVYLQDRADRVVTRDEALRDVWEKPFGGSNMVDAVVMSLRRKLGPFADRIETVTGHGYRFRSQERPPTARVRP